VNKHAHSISKENYDFFFLSCTKTFCYLVIVMHRILSEFVVKIFW